jgi:lysophospholipase L1-like esterase
MIHFPLYNNVKELYIGLQKGKTFKEPTQYSNPQKIVYYGSSITQGGCVSRPDLAYPNQVSVKLDCDFVNLGFSGSAKGEPVMAEYVAGLNPDIFVMDYDHNAPTTEHLKETHSRMFEIIRKANPDLPVVMMTRPKFFLTDEEKERLEIIRKTYLDAQNNGDEKVYLITGEELMSVAGNEGTVDDCHPNDLGFFSMAKAVEKVLGKII